jgi:hypothetical protein
MRKPYLIPGVVMASAVVATLALARAGLASVASRLQK